MAMVSHTGRNNSAGKNLNASASPKTLLSSAALTSKPSAQSTAQSTSTASTPLSSAAPTPEPSAQPTAETTSASPTPAPSSAPTPKVVMVQDDEGRRSQGLDEKEGSRAAVFYSACCLLMKE
eukprot:scaffold26151_cov72-Skeletonema_dohrnii-CCMP3373.AAC.3